MSIHFQCERCGHPIDVDDRFEGKHGKCKHCGHSTIVPARTHGWEGGTGERKDEPALRLRPLSGQEPSELADHLLAAPPPLKIRAAENDPRPLVEMISDPDEPLISRGRGARLYSVTDPYHASRAHSSSGPPPAWTLVPVRTARWVASNLRRIRDWLYLVSLFCLVFVLLGYLFHWKLLLHLGAVGVVASNISMLYVGVAYLVSLPFKESLGQGLANLLIPFYAIYYWSTRWPRMKPAVTKTLGSFLPIALVGLAYLVYTEAPAVEAAVERRLPALEEKLERTTSALETKADKALIPIRKRVRPLLDPKE